jgi:aminoglycoside/choline kinase family phosphotransferase
VLLLYESMKTDTRLSELNNWLATVAPKWSIDPNSIKPASSDASFRRYFRVLGDKNAQNSSFIIMDAPE